MIDREVAVEHNNFVRTGMQKLTVTQLRHVTSVNASSITFYSLSDAAVHATFTKQTHQLAPYKNAARLAP